ncbi:NADH-quinone oxidoreductase subunit NuoN [Pantoea sp. Mhis]|uniref:NADH-quinone oxidoreductase subunit NuoN n=1 Tax=Pantoea sp. Mhis TaxID=2576759 RepID=UPI001357CE16|nr:NADH-quinone oxidoreductase subunit NuoN [Pantoea sp. Mhis]MXP56103.1 NADH-quinone oxidoreductase subunit NuoN [Pantoea sp. Mhis]
MVINTQEFIALLPIIIISLTVILVMLSISLRRNHCISATLTITGFIFALFSLWFVQKVSPIDVTLLFHIEHQSVFYVMLIMLSSIATCIFAYPWLTNFTSNNKDEFYLLVLVASIGATVLVNSNHFIALFIGIELISIPLFGLIGYILSQKYSLEATLKYMILSAVASSFLIFGIGLIYTDTGSLSLLDFGKHIDKNLQPLLLIGLGMMIIAFGFKLSLVPFHIWTPDVYQGTATPALVFLTTANKIAVFGIMMHLFTKSPIINNEVIFIILSIISFVSILFGNLMALLQTNIKRLLGYSSISHFGYIMITLLTEKLKYAPSETSNIYLVSYLLANIGAFGIISLMSSIYHGLLDVDSLNSYRGLFWSRPILSIIMTIMMFSLAGLPITLGFIGKFYILIATINTHLWWLTAAVVIGSAIGLYYYLRIIICLYRTSSKLYICNNTISNTIYLLPKILIYISTLLIILLGIYPNPLINLIKLI